jgi:hypothetical protein
MIDGGLRKIFRSNLPEFHWVSVETGLTEQGIPDSNFCVEGREGWLEYKETATNRVGLRPEQIGWLERRSRAGGLTFIAVRFRHGGGPRKGVPVDSLYIYPGAAARSVALLGLRSNSLLAAFHGGGPSRWPWDTIRNLLKCS